MDRREEIINRIRNLFNKRPQGGGGGQGPNNNPGGGGPRLPWETGAPTPQQPQQPFGFVPPQLVQRNLPPWQWGGF